ncbi:MAG: hypothetical protein OXT69_10615 [Candidatus Poribacteria bacterium]|nr:hypothetical protein [Candidatus Poribacteria bacterium]
MTVQHGRRGAVSLLKPTRSVGHLQTPDETIPLGQTLSWSLTVHQSFSKDRTGSDHFQTFSEEELRWTAEVEMSWDAADASLNQDKLWEAILLGEFDNSAVRNRKVQVNLYVSGSRCYYGAAYIERADVHAPFDGPVTARFQLRGNGPLKFSAGESA